jgi:hypothetical protein
VDISSNRTGSGVDANMQSILVASINDGYYFHRENMQQNEIYIMSKLNATYNNWFWSIIIITEDQSCSAWSGWIVNQTFINWKGVNKYKANWTYFIWAISQFNSYSFDYTEGLGRGYGISDSQFVVINNIIKTAEEEYPTTCQCSAFLIIILDKLYKYDSQKWSGTCRPYTAAARYAYLVNKNYQYLVTSPQKY